MKELRQSHAKGQLSRYHSLLSHKSFAEEPAPSSEQTSPIHRRIAANDTNMKLSKIKQVGEDMNIDFGGTISLPHVTA